MQTITPNRYLVFSGITAGALLLVVAAFNYIVDPYNLLGNNRTGVYFWNERQVKDAILTYDHQAVLIGSSKTGYVNPDDLACFRFYNASMRGMVPEEMFFYLKKYLRNEKLVLIGFDFYMFNQREFPLVPITDWDDVGYTTAEYLMGGHIVKDSWKTLKMWRKGEKMHAMKPNGQFEYPGLSKEAGGDRQAYEKQYHDIIQGLVKHHYADIAFSTRRMDYVRQIKVLLEERKIPYVVFINPLNHDVLAALQQIDAYKLRVGWQQDMREIFPNLYDFSSSLYSAREGFYREDPYHYTNENGVAFLDEMIADFCP